MGDEVRLSAAELIADGDAQSATQACLAIARDTAVGDEVRLSAAELLAEVDPRGLPGLPGYRRRRGGGR